MRAYGCLWPRRHSYDLPSCTLELHKKSFIPRCLYKYIWWFFLTRLRYWMVCTSAHRCFSVIVISETICISFGFFSCVLYYIKLHYITLSYYRVYAILLSLLQLFFCLHVRLLYAITYYLLTYLWQSARTHTENRVMWAFISNVLQLKAVLTAVLLTTDNGQLFLRYSTKGVYSKPAELYIRRKIIYVLFCDFRTLREFFSAT